MLRRSELADKGMLLLHVWARSLWSAPGLLRLLQEKYVERAGSYQTLQGQAG